MIVLYQLNDGSCYIEQVFDPRYAGWGTEEIKTLYIFEDKIAYKVFGKLNGRISTEDAESFMYGPQELWPRSKFVSLSEKRTRFISEKLFIKQLQYWIQEIYSYPAHIEIHAHLRSGLTASFELIREPKFAHYNLTIFDDHTMERSQYLYALDEFSIPPWFEKMIAQAQKEDK